MRFWRRAGMLTSTFIPRRKSNNFDKPRNNFWISDLLLVIDHLERKSGNEIEEEEKEK